MSNTNEIERLKLRIRELELELEIERVRSAHPPYVPYVPVEPIRWPNPLIPNEPFWYRTEWMCGTST